MQLRRVVIIASVLIASAISACGSSTKSNSVTTAPTQTATQPTASVPSSPPPETLDPTFIARADRVCARAKSNLAAHGRFPYQNFNPLHPDVTLLPKVAAYFAATRAVSDRVPVELRNLGTPRRASVPWGQIVLLALEGRSIADRQIKAAQASNASEFAATVIGVEAIGKQLGEKASAIGFPSSSPCSSIL